jgi:hydroxymethylbilane synthase
MRIIRVASRRSALAMRQTEWVIERLRKVAPGFDFQIIPVTTQGDRWLSVPLSQVGGKGLFVTEIEQQLQSGAADLAVHSLKDMPAELAEGLVLAGVPVREDPRDALISRSGADFDALPPGAVIGTSSLRRAAQLKAARSDLVIRPLRGNIDTRLVKLQQEDLDAIVLAAAGLHRMGWADRIHQYLPVGLCLPAAGQGLLGLECREDDTELREALQRITDPDAVLCARAERALLAALGGSCRIPLAAYAEPVEGGLHLRGLVASGDGREVVRAEAQGADPEAVGQAVAEALLRQGADRLMAAAAEPLGR